MPATNGLYGYIELVRLQFMKYIVSTPAYLATLQLVKVYQIVITTIKYQSVSKKTTSDMNIQLRVTKNGIVCYTIFLM